MGDDERRANWIAVSYTPRRSGTVPGFEILAKISKNVAICGQPVPGPTFLVVSGAREFAGVEILFCHVPQSRSFRLVANAARGSNLIRYSSLPCTAWAVAREGSANERRPRTLRFAERIGQRRAHRERRRPGCMD